MGNIYYAIMHTLLQFFIMVLSCVVHCSSVAIKLLPLADSKEAPRELVASGVMCAPPSSTTSSAGQGKYPRLVHVSCRLLVPYRLLRAGY